jgi:protein translocase, SecG subunit
MNWLFTLLVVLIVIASILLTVVVLLQNGKDGGLATNFTSANQALGVRQAASLLEKATWGLVAFILVLSILSTFALRGNAEGNTADELNTEIVNATEAEAPAFPVPQADPSVPQEAPEEPAAE